MNFEKGDAITIDHFTFMLGDYRELEDGTAIAITVSNEFLSVCSATAHLATEEEITKWNDTILKPNNLYYSTKEKKIIEL